MQDASRNACDELQLQMVSGPWRITLEPVQSLKQTDQKTPQMCVTLLSGPQHQLCSIHLLLLLVDALLQCSYVSST